MDWMAQVEAWVVALADTVWVYPLQFVLLVVDGIIPPVPSEAVLIALAALWQTTGSPAIVALFLVGAVGAWCGDQLAYLVGKWLDVDRFLRGPKAQGAANWARRTLAEHGPSLILVTRYVPVVRVAITIIAGSVGYRWHSYAAVTALSSTIWSAYMLATGLLAGAWLSEHPLWAAVLGIVVGLVIGLVVERVARVILRRKGTSEIG